MPSGHARFIGRFFDLGRNGFAQEQSDPDGLNHRFASCEGMMICT